MATTIRLRRMGTNKKPFYRIVVADSRAPRDGRFIEQLGHYDPRIEDGLKIDEEKAKKWLSVGAQPTETMTTLLRGIGILKAPAALPEAKPKPAPKKKPEAKEEAPPEVKEEAPVEAKIEVPKEEEKPKEPAKKPAAKAKAQPEPAKEKPKTQATAGKAAPKKTAPAKPKTKESD